MDDKSWEILKKIVQKWIKNHADHTTIIQNFADWLGVLRKYQVFYGQFDIRH